ncbi:hypothetical protein L1987_57930 [Smallanthus sonchifolius]|uniref:Uncharacterized protein n=1 Tax=Smallanthus sonchifolius TaxID=185202 RepID=A0ACB9DEX3_9ASTR|nr:hypothetical protein L1987_57930 [Smallanthus sonchifolius]
MSSARSHANSADNNTEEPSEHSSSSRGTSASTSLSIHVNMEPTVSLPPSNLRSLPIAQKTWPQGISPPKQTQPQQPQQLPSPRQHQSPLREIGGPSTPILEPHGTNGQPAICHSPRVAPSKRPRLRRYVGDPKPSDEVLSLGTSGMCLLCTPLVWPHLLTHPSKTPVRLEQPKPRTRENARKRTLLPNKVTFKNTEKGEPSTRAPPVPIPQDPSKDYIQLYGYFDWKAEVSESLGWLTSHGTNIKMRLDFHSELATHMSKQNE